MTDNLRLSFLRRATKRRASQFNSITEWTTGHSGSLYQARKHKWIHEIAAELGWRPQERLPTGHWTFENCLAEAKKHPALTVWSRTPNASYRIARQNDWQRSIAADLGWEVKETKKPGYWTEETLLEAAKAFLSMNDWAKGHPTSYRIALKKKIHHKIGKELGWAIQIQKPNQYWTFEKCLQEAGKYPTQNNWKGNSRGSYDKAKKEGWYREICDKTYPSAKTIRRPQMGPNAIRTSLSK